MNKERRAFHRGMLAALAVIHSRDLPTLYGEIVATTDLSELVLVATEDDQMEFSGLRAFLDSHSPFVHKLSGKERRADEAMRRDRQNCCC